MPNVQDVTTFQTHEITKKLNRYLQDRSMTPDNVRTCNYYYAERYDRKTVKKIVKGYPALFPKSNFQYQPKLMPDKACRVILIASAIGNKKANVKANL